MGQNLIEGKKNIVHICPLRTLLLLIVSLKTSSGKPSGTKPDRREKEYGAHMSALNFAPLNCLVKNLVRKTLWDKT